MIKTKKNKLNHKRKTKKVLKGGDATNLEKERRREAIKKAQKIGTQAVGPITGSYALSKLGKNSINSPPRSSSHSRSHSIKKPQYTPPPDYNNNNTPQLSKEIINFIKNYNTKQYYVDLLNQINDINLDYYIDFYKTTYELLQLVKDNNKEYVINLINNINYS